MIGLEWITRDSSCASANFLGQLNGLSIPRTRSLNIIIIITLRSKITKIKSSGKDKTRSWSGKKSESSWRMKASQNSTGLKGCVLTAMRWKIIIIIIIIIIILRYYCNFPTKSLFLQNWWNSERNAKAIYMYSTYVHEVDKSR